MTRDPPRGLRKRQVGFGLLAAMAAAGAAAILLLRGSRAPSAEHTDDPSARSGAPSRETTDPMQATDVRSTSHEGSPQGGGMLHGDRAPGEDQDKRENVGKSVKGYLIGLGLAGLLTAGSFALSGTSLVWGPAVPAALIVFAIAQMGVHLVFFLHLTTAPDNINNALALAFGVLIVLLLIGGSVWIMYHMNQTMMPHGQMGTMNMP